MRVELVQPIGELVRSQAREFGDKPFLIAGRRSESYADYDSRTDRIAGGLERVGVETGSAVAAYMTNSIELLESYRHRQARRSRRLRQRPAHAAEAAFILRDSGAVAVITDEAHVGHVEQARPECAALRQVIVGGAALERLAAGDPTCAIPPDIFRSPAWRFGSST